ncbi:MAG: branched-chain amino acid ABC transporter permease [Candidatus Rokubacteria bacterium]|nr:branched-chain amino acid ABC transporter permease [Candidatus Rokubacteria bacterium]
MMDLVQVLGSGILVGMVYALLGLGVVIVFRASEAFNFAVGEFLVVGAFLFLVFHSDLRLPILVALPLALLAAGAAGGLIERLTINPLLGRSAISMTIVTLGLASVLRALVQLIFGAHAYPFELRLPNITVEIGDVLFLSESLWAGILSLGTFGLVLLFLFRTRWGVAVRATSESQAKALAFGINAGFILFLVWVVSAVCIAISGIVISNFGSLSYVTGIVGLRAIPVVLIGGMDSIGGALVGGIIVGVCEALVGAYVEPRGLIGFKELAPYILLLAVLIVRPYGLFGTVRIERV